MLFFDDDGPKSLVRSTVMVRIFPFTAITTFFMPWVPPGDFFLFPTLRLKGRTCQYFRENYSGIWAMLGRRDRGTTGEVNRRWDRVRTLPPALWRLPGPPHHLARLWWRRPSKRGRRHPGGLLHPLAPAGTTPWITLASIRASIPGLHRSDPPWPPPAPTPLPQPRQGLVRSQAPPYLCRCSP